MLYGVWYAHGVFAQYLGGFTAYEIFPENNWFFGACVDCAGSLGAGGGAAGPSRAIREERSDDLDAGRREAAYRDLHAEECQGGAADFSGAHTLRDLRRR